MREVGMWRSSVVVVRRLRGGVGGLRGGRRGEAAGSEVKEEDAREEEVGAGEGEQVQVKVKEEEAKDGL